MRISPYQTNAILAGRTQVAGSFVDVRPASVLTSGAAVTATAAQLNATTVSWEPTEAGTLTLAGAADMCTEFGLETGNVVFVCVRNMSDTYGIAFAAGSGITLGPSFDGTDDVPTEGIAYLRFECTDGTASSEAITVDPVGIVAAVVE